jgi:hypothetical protein
MEEIWRAHVEYAERCIRQVKDQERKREMELSLSAFRRMMENDEPFPGEFNGYAPDGATH